MAEKQSMCLKRAKKTKVVDDDVASTDDKVPVSDDGVAKKRKLS